ncbi:BlaI/MecI/CopY family transcriptional regulator [Novosphingopyxis sp.]|uniref:BlaI/MecI/CopY family transcriptional regulator n=1 Tax=Novosphingopyxis sp. TaxID=2709690 RepID=UPI003B5A7910
MISNSPTASELAVLRVLWKRKKATVREVHEEVYHGTDTGYTSALKTLQNMLAKGLVTRIADSRQHIYAPAVAERSTLNHVVSGWIDSTFAGSSLALAMQALDARPVSAQELEQLKALVARIEADEG